VVGPEAGDEDAFPLVVAPAGRLRAPVWTAPTPPRCASPTRHPLWQSVLPPSVAGSASTWRVTTSCFTGLWTAARPGPPVTFVVLNNGGYGALRSFVAQMGVAGAPGLDLPGLDAARIAEGYGVPAERSTDGDALAAALCRTGRVPGPSLLEVPITAETPAGASRPEPPDSATDDVGRPGRCAQDIGLRGALAFPAA
jgi:hypothetical protein